MNSKPIIGVIGAGAIGLFVSNQFIKYGYKVCLIAREASQNEFFIIENKKVVFVDDVLYTGRSIRAALTAIQSFGRPLEIELLTFIDRRFSRHLPIQPDYRGRQVDAINNEKVKVCWKENDGLDAVYLINN